MEVKEEPPLKYRHLSPTQSSPKEQENLNKTFDQLDKLSKLCPGEGKEGRWLVDINLLLNDPCNQQPKSQQQVLLDLNTHLLNLYFRYRHTIFPIFSKSIFYRLLENRDPFITPLLLNSMYCHAAHFSHGDAIHANSYFEKAEQLLQQEIHSPSLSLITSLCLLATFESNHYSSGPHVNTQKAFMYLDMACRMCYDLKLHKRYAFHHSGTTPDEVELRKRVYWVCYCYDKLNFLMTRKPMLLCSTMDIDLPSLVLDSDDPNEYEINACFIEHIKLMQICEPIASSDQQANIISVDEQLMYWQSSLPSFLQWTDHSTTSPLVSHLHLIFTHVQLSALSIPSSPASMVMQRKRASIATSLTQMVSSMSEQPHCILSFQYCAETLMAALRIHLLDCADENLQTARHARSMYQQSLRTIKTLLHHRFISVEGFVRVLDNALESDSNPISLSPVIPKHQKYGIMSPVSSSASTPLETFMHRHDDMVYDPPTMTTTPFYNIPKKDEEEKDLMLFTPRYGLGVYASAHQHHTDVLRQHMPNIKTNNLNRPVLLNHFGQVVVQQQQHMD